MAISLPENFDLYPDPSEPHLLTLEEKYRKPFSVERIIRESISAALVAGPETKPTTKPVYFEPDFAERIIRESIDAALYPRPEATVGRTTQPTMIKPITRHGDQSEQPRGRSIAEEILEAEKRKAA
jgi:hypothetical protein